MIWQQPPMLCPSSHCHRHWCCLSERNTISLLALVEVVRDRMRICTSRKFGCSFLLSAHLLCQLLPNLHDSFAPVPVLRSTGSLSLPRSQGYGFQRETAHLRGEFAHIWHSCISPPRPAITEIPAITAHPVQIPFLYSSLSLTQSWGYGFQRETAHLGGEFAHVLHSCISPPRPAIPAHPVQIPLQYSSLSFPRHQGYGFQRETAHLGGEFTHVRHSCISPAHPAITAHPVPSNPTPLRYSSPSFP